MSVEPVRLPQAAPTALIGPDGRRLGFGEAFTNSMALATWSADGGWSELSFSARRPLLLDPAMVALHYGQIVFEGLKAHRLADGTLADGTVAVFRGDAYAERMRRSARRFAMPEPPEEMFLSAVCGVAGLDESWLPDDPETALYLRPMLLATDPCLGLRPSDGYLFLTLAFTTGGFFSDRPEPIRVWVEREYLRAAPGGAGAAKCAGNYAPTYVAQRAAAAQGCDQVVWLDVGRRWVEELGGMNVFVVRGHGESATVLTPPLSDTILPGITRDALLHLARWLGYAVQEWPLSVEQWRADCRSGAITESFACGTAATVTPIGTVVDDGTQWTVGDGGAGPVTLRLRDALREARRGLLPEFRHWLRAARVPAQGSRVMVGADGGHHG